MKALIIDDEKKARTLLQVLLEENCPEVKEIHQAPDLPSGVLAIREFKPDLVFLDIEMPQFSGLQLFDFIPAAELDCGIIFTTAYSEYAIQAFELNAIDYLLKPLRASQLQRAVERASAQRQAQQLDIRLRELQQTLQNPGIRKIGLPLFDGILFVEPDEIEVFQADRMYSKVYTSNEGEVLVSKPLKFFNDLLKDHPDFFQPHRSFLINLKHIRKFSSQHGGYLEMQNGQQVSISRNKTEEFMRRMVDY